jgi:phage terminase large subunit-like protein
LIPTDIYAAGLVKAEDLRYYDTINLDDFDMLYLHADTTHTSKSTSDDFATGVIGMSKKDKNFYILDFTLDKVDVEKQARIVISYYQKYGKKIRKMTYDEKSNQ